MKPSKAVLEWRERTAPDLWGKALDAISAVNRMAAYAQDPFIGGNIRLALAQLRVVRDKLGASELHSSTFAKRGPIPRVEPRRDRPKQCTRCGGWFPVECFHRRKSSPDGRATECRGCVRDRKVNGTQTWEATGHPCPDNTNDEWRNAK